MKKKPLKNILLTALVVLIATGAFAQADVESPYSLFGVGQLSGNAMNVRLKGMGGVSNAIYGSGLINTGNPATLAKMDSLAFLFDAGVYFKTSNFSTSNKTERGANASFDYVALAFGFTDWWKTALGVQPHGSQCSLLYNPDNHSHAAGPLGCLILLLSLCCYPPRKEDAVS